jgi:hypothetical protein
MHREVAHRKLNGFTGCGKTLVFDFALKGRGFSRAVSVAKSMAALQIAEKLKFRIRASLHNLRKKPALPLILGGAAVYRCGNRLVLNSALAAEGTALDQELLFPQAVQRYRKFFELRCPFRGCAPTTEFFINLFSRRRAAELSR